MDHNERMGILIRAVNALSERFSIEVIGPLNQDTLFVPAPREVRLITDSLNALNGAVRTPVEDIPPALLPVLKRAILDAHLKYADELEAAKERVSDPEVTATLDAQLLPLEEVLNSQWIRDVDPARLPQLSDFLTVERAEYHLRGEPAADRQYDEKFHILQAPSLFLVDLDHFRKRCRIRRASMVVAYMDIDDFKEFNTERGETYVDRHLLPRFMAALEAHVFGHGFAYRFGGDEYAALLLNCDARAGTQLLEAFQRRIALVQYGDFSRKPTVSIGLVEVLPDSNFTNRQALALAEGAKNDAKGSGKNRLVQYSRQVPP